MAEAYQENEDSRADANPAEQFGPGESPGEFVDPADPADPAGDERGIDELIEIAEEIPDQLGLSEGLAALRATASSEGLSVTVNMHGMLVHLDIGEPALELGPDALAAEISRLSTEAGTQALHQGLSAIRAGCVPAVAAAVEDELALDEVPEPTPDPAATRAPDPAPPPAPPARRRAPAEESDDGGFVLKPVKE
ncbi:hypothetical protein [Amycolatopsis nivea]|uniref:hypothetical protein n=1 Tax=Amycolatopsis nivea TaxID=1644109 RepID=UPI00196BA960|nr:hypothetical protein [Amycolatopsis nivea]